MIVFAFARASGMLSSNQLARRGARRGLGRFWPIARLLPFVALVTAGIVQGARATASPGCGRAPAAAPGSGAHARRRGGLVRDCDPRRGHAARELAAHALRLLEPAAHEEQLVGHLACRRKRRDRAARPRPRSSSSSTTRPCASSTRPSALSTTSRPAAPDRVHRRGAADRARERREPIARRRRLLEPLGVGEPVHARFERRAQQRRLVAERVPRVLGERARTRRRRSARGTGHVATPSCAGTHGGAASSAAACRCGCRSAGAGPRLRSPLGRECAAAVERNGPRYVRAVGARDHA